MILRKAWAFIRRDFQIETSYSINFLITAANSLFPLVLFFFVSQLVSSPGSLEQYGGDYFAYSLIGLAFTRYFQLALGSFSDSIQRAQVTGCLEAMLGSQTPAQVSVLLSSLYSLIVSALQLALIFMVGVFVFGFDLSRMNLFSTGLVFMLSLLIFLSFGIVSAACIVVLKKGDPLGWLLTSSNAILGGAFFPVDIMPGWLERISNVIPAKYSLDALRMTILRGEPVAAVSGQVLVLCGIALVFVPLSIKLFLSSVEHAKRTGTLIQY